MRVLSLKSKFAVLLVALISLSLAVNMLWTAVNTREQVEAQLREKGAVLAQQMNCVWEFMVSNQDRLEQISFTENGVYQGLHCAIVGRSIGALFTSQTDYVTRYVNFNPRNSADEPDEFEAAALRAFIDEGTHEYYQVVEADGREVFRYMAPMKIDQNCLKCHGEPAGELDVTGHLKEGWSLNDVGGAISITMPMDVYVRTEQQTVRQNVEFFAGMLLVCLLIVFVALSALVTRPLQRIRDGVSSIRQGNLEARVGVPTSSVEMHDLSSDFNSMARDLAQSYATLEEQVDDRTAALAKANEELRRQQTRLEEANLVLSDENRMKSEFLAMMSHELRTPLTNIIAFTELLRRDCGHLSNEEEQSVSKIESNSQVLLMMINDILEMSRVDAGRARLQRELIDVGDVVLAVEEVIGPLAQRRGVAFATDVSADTPLVYADFEKLRHILTNLCNNAVKFTDAGGAVTLLVDCVEESAGQKQLRMRVRDNGIGIALGDQGKIFDRFVQADSSSSRRHGGTGLGLTLAKEYVEMHGGAIAMRSELGKGSEFEVTLPVIPPNDEADNASRRM